MIGAAWSAATEALIGAPWIAVILLAALLHERVDAARKRRHLPLIESGGDGAAAMQRMREAAALGGLPTQLEGSHPSSSHLRQLSPDASARDAATFDGIAEEAGRALASRDAPKEIQPHDGGLPRFAGEAGWGVRDLPPEASSSAASSSG